MLDPIATLVGQFCESLGHLVIGLLPMKNTSDWPRPVGRQETETEAIWWHGWARQLKRYPSFQRSVAKLISRCMLYIYCARVVCWSWGAGISWYFCRKIQYTVITVSKRSLNFDLTHFACQML